MTRDPEALPGVVSPVWAQRIRLAGGVAFVSWFGASLFWGGAEDAGPRGKLALMTVCVGLITGLLLVASGLGAGKSHRPTSLRRLALALLHGAGIGFAMALIAETYELVGQPHTLFTLCFCAAVCVGVATDFMRVPHAGTARSGRLVRYAHLVGINVWVSWALLEILVRGFVAVTGAQWVAVSGPAALPPHMPIHEGYRTNALGFYDDEFSTDREPDSTYVLALGDSFAFGVVPPPDNYLTRVEALWTERWGSRVEVLNCGVPGSGPEDYLALLPSLADRLPVDAVLLTLFIGNDITEWHPERPFPALRHSYAVTAARRFLPVVTARVRSNMAPELQQFSDEAYLALVRRRLAVCQVDPLHPGYARTIRLLQDVLNVCGDRGLPLAVVFAPAEFQVSEPLQQRLSGVARVAFDLELPQRTLAPNFAAYNVPVVDLLPALRQADRDAPTYIPNNTHWNARGNAVAADAIAAALPEPESFVVPGGVPAR